MGFDLLVHYHKSEQDAWSLEEEVVALGSRIWTISLDLSEPLSVAELGKFAESHCKSYGSGLSLLVNSASTFGDSHSIRGCHDLFNETIENWETALAVNLRAPFFLIQNLADVLKISGESQIINILDTSVRSPFLTRASHSISKTGLSALTVIAARSFGNRVRANAIVFGKMLPPTQMDIGESVKQAWAGAEPVRKSIRYLVENCSINGEHLWVCGNDI